MVICYVSWLTSLRQQGSAIFLALFARYAKRARSARFGCDLRTAQTTTENEWTVLCFCALRKNTAQK
jgi:hypothetical protein